LRGFPSESASRKTLGAVEYVRRLEEVLIRTCAEFGISTKRISGLTGVWTGPSSPPSFRGEQDDSLANRSAELRDMLFQEAKIAALGVHISRGVTSHGLALNVNTDLSYFNLIIPCGITSRPVTSIKKELGREVPMQEVAHLLSRSFGTVFRSQMLWLDNLDALLGNNIGVPMRPPENLRKLSGEEDSAWA
jgi:lipoyl(octanoyl) transferase